MASNFVPRNSYRVAHCSRCKHKTVLIDGNLCVGCANTGAKPAKYRNVKAESPLWPGVTFDSMKEARIGAELKLREKAGEIRDLQRQVRFNIIVNGQKVCAYVADFVWKETRTIKARHTLNPDEIPHELPIGSVEVVADVKSEPTKTDVYRLKKKLLKAALGIEIVEM